MAAALFFLACGLALLLALAYKLFRADADLRLHTMASRRPVPDDGFEGKVVWVTGASQGLGAALARYFAGKGARLVLSSRSREALEAVKASCSGSHAPDGVEVLSFDLCAGDAALRSAAATAAALHGGAGVDVLVHCAGMSQDGLAEATGGGAVRRLFELNCVAPIALTKAALPLMLQRGGGRFVVVASMAAVLPSAGQAVYAGAKAGLVAYFRTMATEVCDRGVGVTVVCPGPIAASGERPRYVYGEQGVVEKPPAASEARSRPTGERVAALIGAAAYHELEMAWIARKPVLQMAYLQALLPGLAYTVMKLLGPARARVRREGGSGYDLRSLLRQARRSGGGGEEGSDAAAAPAADKKQQ